MIVVEKVKNKTFIIVLVILMICIFPCCVEKQKENSFNNVDKIEEKITKKYSEKEIDALIEHILELDFEQLNEQFELECVRKTFQGYYTVLLQDNGKKLFVFFDENLQTCNYCLVDKISCFDDFDFVVKDVTTKDQILNFDKNTIAVTPFSSDNTTKHLVEEGILVFVYDNENTVKEINLIKQ